MPVWNQLFYSTCEFYDPVLCGHYVATGMWLRVDEAPLSSNLGVSITPKANHAERIHMSLWLFLSSFTITIRNDAAPSLFLQTRPNGCKLSAH